MKNRILTGSDLTALGVKAWTGGSAPPNKLPYDAAKLAGKLYADQIATFKKYNRVRPDKDTRNIFKNRARHDAWSTVRAKYEKKQRKKNPSNPFRKEIALFRSEERKAKRARLAGKIQTAMRHENNADKIYIRIPEQYRPELLNPRHRKKNPSARFTVSQLSRLRVAYSKLDRIDPGKSGYKLLAVYLDGMTQPQLKQLAGAQIKFLSKLAINRIRK